MPFPIWRIRNFLIFFYALTVYLSYSQVILLAGGYAPVGFILTPSDMPWAPPLSMIILSPEFKGEGWGVKFIDGALGLKVPVVHYFYCDHSGCYEYIPNSKARFGSTPWETAVNMLEALLPPWTPAVFPSSRPAYGVVFMLPAWVYIPLMLFALRYKLYYLGRRVW